MRNTLFGFALGIGCMIILIALLSNTANDSDPATLKSKNDDDSAKMLPQIVKSPKLKDSYTFAGESIDLTNDDTRERLEKELLRNTYFHRNTMLIMKRTARYFPYIEKTLAEAGLPDDLKYIAVIESDLDNVTSPAGAKGVWQFMSAVGKSFGLEVNSEVDERYHFEKATQAAAKHLGNYYKQFGQWQYVAAAYNMGEGNMRKYIRQQQIENYDDLNINQETMAYLYRALAMKSILENPREFGFYLDDEDYYQPFTNFKEVEVTSSITSLATWAKERNMSYRDLKRLNPWLIDSKLTISKGNSYLIRVSN